MQWKSWLGDTCPFLLRFSSVILLFSIIASLMAEAAKSPILFPETSNLIKESLWAATLNSTTAPFTPIWLFDKV